MKLYANIDDDAIYGFNLQPPCYLSWMKETVALGLKMVAVHLRENLHQDIAFEIFEILKFALKVFQNFRTCQYLLEQLF